MCNRGRAIRIMLSSDQDNFGAYVSDGDKPTRTTHLRISKLTTFEPLSKTAKESASLASKSNICKMLRSLRQGRELPPLLVRKHGLKHQVIDGHHRLEAYKQDKRIKLSAKIIAKFHVKMLP